jgi:NAD(P)H-hydrate epimerase
VKAFDPSTMAEQVLETAATCDVAVIGPGLSLAPPIADGVREVVNRLEIPFVLDADGLNAFESAPELLTRGKAPRVLTPHPGEASRLIQIPIEDIQANRTLVAKELASRFLAVAVLKGHRTLVTDGSKLLVNKTGNPGMATGGTGDVLAGVIAAFIGQKLAPFDAASLGVHVHGKAGDLAARALGEPSLMATDLLDALPRALRAYKS